MNLQQLLLAKTQNISLLALLILATMFLLPLKDVSAVGGPCNLRRACVSPNKDIVLFWVSEPDNCGSFIQYKIYGRKTVADPWILIDSVNTFAQNTYTHLGAAGLGTSWQYKIVVENDCGGMPTQPSDSIFVDLTAPSVSEPDSVSINPIDGNIIVGWKKNATSDLAGYTIYQQTGSTTTNVGNTSDTFFVISGLNTADSAFTFKLAAFDSCGNLSPSISNHTTIHLQSVFDDCAGVLNLDWSDYKGWPGVQKYDIIVSRNGNPFDIEKSVDGTTLKSSVDTIHPGDIINVFVRAYNSTDNSISSTSNMFSISVPTAKMPKINYLSLVTIVENKSAEISWVTDTSAEISFFKIRRGVDLLNLNSVADIKFDSTKTEYTYKDTDPKATFDKTSYFYQIEVFDNCKNSSGSFSNVSNTIVTNIMVLNDTQNMVVWNPYLGFQNDVGYYYVYRGLEFNGKYEWSIIGSTKPSDTFFVDLNTPPEAGNTGICYRVVAFENLGNPLTNNQVQSVSSYSCELKDFKIFFPTAFNPFGVNRKWVPRGSYINYEKSEIKIYNRWGQFIKIIDDLHDGWDGKDANGAWLEPGPYIYYATITGVNKRKETFTGDFVYLR